jgi:hypothetical protein
MIPLLSILAADAEISSLDGWWGITQKLGIGATFILGLWVFVLLKQRADETKVWQAALKDKEAQLATEVAYGKSRDRETLTVMSELMGLTRSIDARDKDSIGAVVANQKEVLSAISQVGAQVHTVRDLILEHKAAAKAAAA